MYVYTYVHYTLMYIIYVPMNIIYICTYIHMYDKLGRTGFFDTTTGFRFYRQTYFNGKTPLCHKQNPTMRASSINTVNTTITTMITTPFVLSADGF